MDVTPTINGPPTVRTRNPLLLEDLFQCILDSLTIPETNLYAFKDARPALVALALTCHALSGPSLDRLWYKLDSLEPLIRCYATVVDQEKAKTPPSPTEWTIIHRYSHRIRELTLLSSDNLSPYFVQATSLHPSLLVPNLKVLRWDPPPPSESPTSRSAMLIHRLLNPSLVLLSVSAIDTDDATLQSFLANYPFLCPNLKSIFISLYGRKDASPKAIKALSRSIIHNQRVECLDVSTPIDDVAFLHIAMSPKLKILGLMLHPDKSNLHQVHIPSDAAIFCNVEELLLRIWDLDFVTSLLRAQGQAFRSFELRYYSQPTIEAIHSFVTALASTSRARSLRSINIFPYQPDMRKRHATSRESHIPHHLTYDTLRIFSSFSHLCKLDLNLGYWLSLDDDDLRSLASNWPSLQVLRLLHKQNFRSHPWKLVKYITLKGLLSLLECCPNLYRLALSVDAMDVPIDTGHIVCNPALKWISFPESPINDPCAVHGFLARHFPSVMNVSSPFISWLYEDDSADAGTYMDSWDAVNVLLREARGLGPDSEL